MPYQPVMTVSGKEDGSQNRHQLHGFILLVVGLRLFKIPQGLAVIDRLLSPPAGDGRPGRR